MSEESLNSAKNAAGKIDEILECRKKGKWSASEVEAKGKTLRLMIALEDGRVDLNVARDLVKMLNYAQLAELIAQMDEEQIQDIAKWCLDENSLKKVASACNMREQLFSKLFSALAGADETGSTSANMVDAVIATKIVKEMLEALSYDQICALFGKIGAENCVELFEKAKEVGLEMRVNNALVNNPELKSKIWDAFKVKWQKEKDQRMLEKVERDWQRMQKMSSAPGAPPKAKTN